MSKSTWACSCLLVVSVACSTGESKTFVSAESVAEESSWDREWRWMLSGQAPSECALRNPKGRMTLSPIDGLAVMETFRGEWVHDTVEKGARTVLRQDARNASSVFNVVLSDKVARDLELEVSLRSIDGEIDRGGGLVWRAQDGDNYYIARFNPLEDNYRVYTVASGVRTELASAAATVQPDTWSTLTVRMQGDHIECELDGVTLLDVHDSTFPDAGRIGLWTKADARTEFDELVLRTRER